MPLALRAPLRSACLALCGSLRLILPLKGLPGDVANDFPAALNLLDRHYFFPLSLLAPFRASILNCFGKERFEPMFSNCFRLAFLLRCLFAFTLRGVLPLRYHLALCFLLAIRTSPLSRSTGEPDSA